MLAPLVEAAGKRNLVTSLPRREDGSAVLLSLLGNLLTVVSHLGAGS